MNYSEEIKEKAIKDYMEGATAPEIEDKYGVKRGALQTWLKKKGIIKAQYVKIPESVVRELGERWINGENSCDLAKEIGVKPDKLRYEMYKYGFSLDKKVDEGCKDVVLEEVPDYDFYVPNEEPIKTVVFYGKRYQDITAQYCGC